MKKRTIGICILATLLLTACGDDSGAVASNQAGKNDSAVQGPAVSNQASTKDTAVQAMAGKQEQTSKTYSGFDIAGVYIGMSPEEAEAQLKAYDSAMVVKSSSQYFNYSALGKRYKTDPHLAVMVGSLPGGVVNIEVGFSFPPSPSKVISVHRIHRQTTAPSTLADYTASLTEKYGTPAKDYFDNAARVQILEWSMPGGTVDCTSDMGTSAGNPVLESMIQDGHRMANPTPEYTQNCKSIMRYSLRGDPVIHASGKLMDVAAAAKAEFETQAWIEQLVAEKSRAGTEKPKL